MKIDPSTRFEVTEVDWNPAPTADDPLRRVWHVWDRVTDDSYLKQTVFLYDEAGYTGNHTELIDDSIRSGCDCADCAARDGAS